MGMGMGMGDGDGGTAQTELRPNSVLGLNIGDDLTEN